MKAVFAIPGDKDRRTGGFIYEARVLDELNICGCPTGHLQLPDSFPIPTEADMITAIDALRAVPLDQAIILDGLVFGAIDPDGLAQVAAPIIAMIHHPLGLETGIEPNLAQHLLANEAACLQHAAHVVVPSPHTADILVKRFGAERGKLSIALPGFDRPVVAPNPQDPPIIVSIGLLAERKGHDVLLDALAQIKDLSWQSKIIGKRHDHATAEALERQNQALNLQDRVTFTGELDQQTMHDHLNAASLFALATRYEGYGMVLSEAMLFGLPVVSCDTGAVPDTVGDAGLLVPVDDAEALAQAMRQILTDPETHKDLRSKALAKAGTLPRWSDTARIMVDVVEQIRR